MYTYACRNIPYYYKYMWAFVLFTPRNLEAESAASQPVLPTSHCMCKLITWQQQVGSQPFERGGLIFVRKWTFSDIMIQAVTHQRRCSTMQGVSKGMFPLGGGKFCNRGPQESIFPAFYRPAFWRKFNACGVKCGPSAIWGGGVWPPPPSYRPGKGRWGSWVACCKNKTDASSILSPHLRGCYTPQRPSKLGRNCS